MNIGFIGVNEVLEFGLKQLLAQSKESLGFKNCNLSFLTDATDIYFIDLGSDLNFTRDRFSYLRANHPEKSILLYISEHNLNTITEYLKLGAQGVMTYECEFEEILDSIKLIAKGGKAYCNKVLDILLVHNQLNTKQDCLPVQLSQREIEIVQQIATGKSSKEIGDYLCLSHHTINTHRKNIMKKIGVRKISELVLFAKDMGLLKNNLHA